jgi:thioredoxin-like negative regulator of GroEL
MIERALFVLILFAAGIAFYHLVVRRQKERARANVPVDPLLTNCKPGVPTIVYFTTPTCAPCRLQQTPVLEQLRRELDDDHLRLIRVDATEDPEAAARWRVFSVPTLFVLDGEGQPRRVFNGVVGLETLRQELQAG